MNPPASFPVISDEEFERIGALIHDASSPVGIDARKTHIIIIHMLTALERRMAQLEERLESLSS